MTSKEVHPTFLLIIIMSSLWGSSADLLDTIKQGDVLNSSQYLVSANRKFTLGYFKPTSQYKNNSYFAIWYTNVTDNTVWIGNRDRPISNDSTAFLTLDHLGKLMINSSGFGGDPFVIYSGGQTENTISFVNSQGDGVSDMRADDDTANLSPSVSREYCWNDRDCLAYGDDAFGPGCHIWKGKLQFVQDFSGRSPRRYVIITEPKSKK
ncbi:g-type lectin s-receptor-like serine/threonine-protein kinase [Quercus suber]|uniref:G-type lectin s-receptor-like serine/threonine-protein kinase n=1 Tax=Quercus suber TaxID=58331 RepID=A0AAW0KCX0_QUESU